MLPAFDTVGPKSIDLFTSDKKDLSRFYYIFIQLFVMLRKRKKFKKNALYLLMFLVFLTIIL